MRMRNQCSSKMSVEIIIVWAFVVSRSSSSQGCSDTDHCPVERVYRERN